MLITQLIHPKIISKVRSLSMWVIIVLPKLKLHMLAFICDEDLKFPCRALVHYKTLMFNVLEDLEV